MLCCFEWTLEAERIIAETNLYDILDVGGNPTMAEIQQAKRKFGRRFHPDKCQVIWIIIAILNVNLSSDDFCQKHALHTLVFFSKHARASPGYVKIWDKNRNQLDPKKII